MTALISPWPSSVDASPPLPANGGDLAEAFRSFSSVAASLEHSYAELQGEVSQLRHELQERNRALAASLEETRRTRQHLQRIVASLPCGVLVESPAGEVFLANAECRRLLGMNPDALPEELLPAAARQLLALAPEGGGERESSYGTEPGAFVAVGRSQLPPADGGSVIFILRDITEARRLEQERDGHRRQQALAELSAVLAHEVRNPLGSLELFSGLLEDSGLNPTAQGHLTQLRAGLRNLAATVNNVLRFHNPVAGDFAEVDLARLLASSAEFLAPLAHQAGVTIRLAHQLDRVLVRGDRFALEQVLLNLAINAFHAMAGSGVLTLSGAVGPPAEANAGGQWAVVEVQDTGPGIAEENMAAVFNPGFTTRPASAGLGLAVCRTIIEQHGGRIAISSHPGGCRFRLELPLGGGLQ
jgi:signal transduction histidine kinase